MYRVLVAIDEDRTRAEQVADAVATLAQAVEEFEAIIVHVFQEINVPPQVAIHQPTDDYEEMLDELREAPPTIQQVVERLEPTNADIEVIVTEGNPAEQIIELSEEENVDGVFISGRKHSPTGKVLFGSVTQSVLLNTDIPVTVAGSRRGNRS